ncbi:fructose-2,6-bisphosphatase [Spongiibacter sp. IMCC21906]|uniref:histidine phosphatase family protein n=1 Tax=Spongiibacter sp. IMCC21906 TaxID=1620392 RepID=UPI00062DCD4E|nr:histidine phosphatase family protein [Spongiibacter sp. IMCC21906]AKH68921.1 fructose-2,6-bisphosphatase [Spongiibacter sp. IMCC21906]
MAKIDVSRIDLLRHGACQGGEIFRGSTDVLLSELGWQQMQDKLASLSSPGWDHIVSSPLQRCWRFATAVSEERGLPLEHYRDFREMHFGDWEGLKHDEARQQYPEEWRQFWSSPDMASPPNGEAMPDFCQRVTTAQDALVEQYQGKRVLLVAHGAVIRVMICHWLGMPMGAMTRLSVPYAGLSRFEIYHQQGRPPWVQLVSHG